MTTTLRLLRLTLTVVTMVTIAETKMVDMTHMLNKDSHHSQLFRDFEKTVALNQSIGTLGRLWALSHDVAFSEHTGTHIDSPIHMHADRLYLEQIPIDKLVGPAVVFDLTKQMQNDPDYGLALEDIEAHEETHGRIEDGSIILTYSRGGEVYTDIKTYYGTETPDDGSTMHFPAFGGEATKWLIEERKIKGIGVDRLSVDVGNSTEYPAHYYMAANNVWGLENVNRVWELPPRGATVFIMPILIQQGSGGPVRMVAFTDKWDLYMIADNGKLLETLSGSAGLRECILVLLLAVVTAMIW